jgi:hypothetical protein
VGAAERLTESEAAEVEAAEADSAAEAAAAEEAEEAEPCRWWRSAGRTALWSATSSARRR